MKQILAGVGILALILGMGFYVWSGDNNSDERLMAVKAGDVTEKAVAQGVLVPKTVVNVKSQIRGLVAAVAIKEGQYIKKGTKLLEVKPEPTPEEYAKYKQTLELKKVREQSLRKEFDRLNSLWQQKLVSSKAYDDAQIALEEASLETKLAQENLNLIEKGKASVGGKNIENVVVSPIDGFVMRRNVQAGDAVVPLSDAQEGTVLFTIADMTEMVFKGTSNEIDVNKIKPQQQAQIQIAALPDLALTGQVKYVALYAEGFDASKPFDKDITQQQTRFRLDIEGLRFPEHMTLRAGLSATAEIQLHQARDVPVLPERLLSYDQNIAYVMKWRPAIGKAERQVVTTGITDGLMTEIRSGLQVGDQVQKPGGT